jgi:2-dehydropantoate 2-reductase
MNNSVYIIGAGAIGKALAAFLVKENKDVVLIRGSVDNLKTHTDTIHVLLADDTEQSAKVEVSTLDKHARLDGIVVLTNKSYGNKSLAFQLQGKINESPLVILQNGLGIEQAFVDLRFPEIYRCVLFATCQPVDKDRLRFKPAFTSQIGIIKGDMVRLETITRQLSSFHFPFRVEVDIQPVIWNKAIINCVFNSICPLLEVDNGIFYREPAVLELAQRVILECVGVSKAKGIALGAAEILEGLLSISKSSDGQFISTLLDIRNKRETEIETLNFEVVRIAKTVGKGDCVRETLLLGEMTKWKSEVSLAK